MRIIKTHLRGAAALTTLVIKQSFYAIIHWFLSLYIKYHFGRKEVYSFRCQVNPYNCSREISRYETQYGVTEIISGDKMLCKHNPKMKSYERKHLLMRINFISFHPQ